MKNKDKQNKSIEDLTYDILGNAFVGNLFDISNDIDNTSQNLVAYSEPIHLMTEVTSILDSICKGDSLLPQLVLHHMECPKMEKNC